MNAWINKENVIMALVVLLGGGNVLQTRQSEKELNTDFDRAIKEVHELHTELMAAMERQKEILKAVQNQPISPTQ